MAELLIANFSNQRHDRGDIVEVRANGALYGAKEILPTFIIVKIPTVTLHQVLDYQQEWKRTVNLSAAYDLSTDAYQLDLSSIDAGASGHLTKAELDAFVLSWNMLSTDETGNVVRVTATGFDLMTSQAFIGRIDDITFELLSHDGVTGNNIIQATYTRDNTTSVEKGLINKGATIISHDNKVCVYTMAQARVREQFKDEIKDRCSKLMSVCKHKITEAACDIAVSAGGVITATPSQVQGYLVNKVS